MTRDWKQKLSKSLVIVGEQPRVLATLNEAGLFLIEQVHTHGETPDLRSAIMLLQTAAQSRDPDDVAEATDEVEAVLRAHRLN
jgi:hypothetical protein